MLIWRAFMITWEMFDRRISLSLVLLLLLVNFVSGFRLELMYISLTENIRPHSSPWISAACTAAIVHRNCIFHLYQKDKSSNSKVKFRQASNRCKRVLEAAKLAYANKTKESTSQKLGSRDFLRIANSVLNKGKFDIPSLFNSLKVLSSASDKAKLFAANFSKNSNLDDSGISLPIFVSRTNWNCIIFL